MKTFRQFWIFSGLCTCLASGQEVWTHRYSSPFNTSVGNIVGKPGLYVVQSGYSEYLRSTDGIIWSLTGNLPPARLMASTPSGFIGAGDVIYSTQDGLLYVVQFRPPGGRSFSATGIASGNGCWVVVTQTGDILRSLDVGGPTSWDYQLSPAGTYTGVAFGEGIYLASSGKYFVTSVDGISWRLKANPGRVVIQGFGDGKFYGLNEFSTDQGVNWQAFTGPSGSIVSISNDSKSFVAVTNDNQLYTSPNLTTWTLRESEITDLSKVSFCGDLWVAGSFTGRISTSPVLGAPPLTAPPLTLAPAVELKWGSITGRKYQIQSSSDNGVWENVGLPMLGNGSGLRFTAPVEDFRKFFRVEVR